MKVSRWLVAVMIMIIGLLAFSVWPTPWRVMPWHEELVRINRFSGAAEVLTADGWSRLERNPFRALAAEEKRRQQRFIDSIEASSKRPRSP